MDNLEKEILNFEKKSYLYSKKATLAQTCASFVVSLTYFLVGVLITTETVIVGHVLNKSQDILTLDEEEASWFGSLPMLLQPVGALTGITVQDYVGQRYGLILSNIFALISLLLLHFAQRTATAVTAAVVIGLSLGFTEPSGMGFISEFSEPRIRGYLSSGTLAMLSVGMLFEYVLSSLVHWRTGVLINALIPIFSIVLLFWIPDSPIWLLSKQKKERAMDALKWLRGWVTKEEVQEEFDDMCTFVKASLAFNQVASEQEEQLMESSDKEKNKPKAKKPSLLELLSRVFERRTLYPLFLISMHLLILNFACACGARTYVINLFEDLRMPIDKELFALTVGIATVAGNLLITVLLKYTGKRALTLVSVFLSSVICLCIGIYVHYKDQLQMHWIFMVLIFLLFFESFQCGPIPWLMMGEVFPVRTRNAGSGLAGAIFDFVIFVFLKTYFTVDRLLGTSLFFSLNGILGLLGCVYLYFYLPETEGKSLEEIERIFSKRPKSK